MSKIIHAIVNNDTVNELHIVDLNSSMEFGWIKAIENLLIKKSSLYLLELRKCNISNIDAYLIANGLANNKTLKILNLSMNPLTSATAASLIQAINKNQALQLLNLSNTNISDNIENLALALSKNHSLNQLLLGNNKINDSGINCLASYLKNNTTIKQLSLQSQLSNINQQSHSLLKKLFQKNYWMDEVSTNAFKLNRTVKERMLQIERESLVEDKHGNKILLKYIKNIFEKHHPYIMEKYLRCLENDLDEYKLSYAELFALLSLIDVENKRLFQLFNNSVVKLFFNSFYFFEVFKLLKNLNLINENNFKTYYFLANDKKHALYELFSQQAMKKQVTKNQNIALDRLFIQVNFNLASLLNRILTKVCIQQQDLLSILSLSQTNIERLQTLVINLNHTGMLNRENILYALDKINFKHLPVNESQVTKISRKLNPGMTNSKIIIDDSVAIFLQHKKNKNYNQGGIGKIKKGYITIPSSKTEASYGIKKIDDESAVTYARRGVRYNHLFGRAAYFYQVNNIYTVISSWQAGRALCKYEDNELNTISIADRFHCMMSGLADIEKLHNLFYIHGDIKPDNFVVDFVNNKMSLIDFDGVRKQGSKSKIAPFTDNYHAENFIFEKQSFCDDVNAMGMTIKTLFPEIFPFGRCKNENTLPIMEYAISLLVSSMMHKNRFERCTIANALQYVKDILNIMDTLDKGKLHLIAGRTISTSTNKIENVIRGRLK